MDKSQWIRIGDDAYNLDHFSDIQFGQHADTGDFIAEMTTGTLNTRSIIVTGSYARELQEYIRRELPSIGDSAGTSGSRPI